MNYVPNMVEVHVGCNLSLLYQDICVLNDVQFSQTVTGSVRGIETERAGEGGSGSVRRRGRGRREGGTADTGDESSMINNLIRLEPLTRLPLANFGSERTNKRHHH